jgi:hypothetical protein
MPSQYCDITLTHRVVEVCSEAGEQDVRAAFEFYCAVGGRQGRSQRTVPGNFGRRSPVQREAQYKIGFLSGRVGACRFSGLTVASLLVITAIFFFGRLRSGSLGRPGNLPQTCANATEISRD